MTRSRFTELNQRVRFMMFTVFQVVPGALPDVRDEVVDDAHTYLERVAESPSRVSRSAESTTSQDYVGTPTS